MHKKQYYQEAAQVHLNWCDDPKSNYKIHGNLLRTAHNLSITKFEHGQLATVHICNWLTKVKQIYAWILSKDVVLAVQYKVYLVKRVISLVDSVQYS